MADRGLIALACMLPGILLIQACATPAMKTSHPGHHGVHGAKDSARAALPPQETPANEAAELRDIQNLYVKGAYEAALIRLDAFEARHPKSAYLGYADNLRGLVHLSKKDPAQAANHFARAIKRGSPSPGFNNYILYNLASAQLELRDLEATAETLARIRPELLDNENRLKYHQLRAQLSLRREHYFEAAKQLLSSTRFYSAEQRDAVLSEGSGPIALLSEILEKIENTLALDQLYRDAPDSPLAGHVLFRLITKEIGDGNNAKAEEYFQLLRQNQPDARLTSRALDLVRKARRQAPPDLQVVGVLLPMTGKFARFGERALNAIQLAFGVFPEGSPGVDQRHGPGVTLIIEDSGEEPEQAVSALNRLVLEHRVGSVLGPILSKGIDQVSQRAEELGVPLISLARYGDPSGEFVMNAGLTMKDQAREIARHAIERLKLRRFAILTPQDKMGQETAHAFWDAVDELGGEVTGYESYPVGETDFRQTVDKLSGLFYSEARHRELAELAKLRQENNIRRRSRRTEQYFALTPIVDYEAVFIPDEAGVSGQILPTFAYRDVDRMVFLGTSAWNSAELPRRAQNDAGKAIFVDAFYPQSNAPHVVRFVNQYQGVFDREPSAIEAIAFDAARVLESALSDGPVSPGQLVRALRSTRNFSGVTGTIRYAEGALHRNVHFLTFAGDMIVPAMPNR